jgi:Alkyl hydroperoxide reductase, large subunit
MLEEHVRMYEGEDFVIKAGERVEKVSKIENGFELTTNMGSYQAKAVLVATGSTRRKLDVPGAKEYENKGITYCASCDGPLFSGQDVAVIGGGNAGFETAAQLLAYAKSVTLLHHGTQFKADARTVENVLAHPNMKGILNADTKEIKGEKFVKSLTYAEASGTLNELTVGGIFVEIGLMPTTWFVEGLSR